eukprot:5484016-Amphidinium_carterae.1
MLLSSTCRPDLRRLLQCSCWARGGEYCSIFEVGTEQTCLSCPSRNSNEKRKVEEFLYLFNLPEYGRSDGETNGIRPLHTRETCDHALLISLQIIAGKLSSKTNKKTLCLVQPTARRVA